MKLLCFVFVTCAAAVSGSTQKNTGTMHHAYTFLALGDSYTIGEGVELQKSFSYQTIGLMRNAGYTFYAPEVIAKTGWTTDELETAVNDYTFLPKYDFVSLLIGVNNQYRSRAIIEYKEDLERLVKKSIALAGGKPEHVLLLSIPDYSASPFASPSDSEKIAKEIDEYNTLNRALSVQFKTQYIDVTVISRKAGGTADAFVADGLHPSDAEYRKWAKETAAVLKEMVKK